MTSPSSRRAGVVQGSQHAATGPEPSSDVGPASISTDRSLRLAQDSELLVSELVTNAVKATAGRDEAAIRLQLSGDSTRVLIEVWDADSRPPVLKDLGEHGTPDPQEEGGRGLFLVMALSAHWDWYPTREPAGKVVWCELTAGPTGPSEDAGLGPP